MHSYLFSPQLYLLLLEIPSFFLVDEHQVQEVSALKPIVHVRICWSQISAGQVESNRNTFSFNRSSIHYLEFVQILRLGDCILSASHNLFPYYTQFHMLDLDSNQVEEYFAQNTVFQMKFAIIEFKFDMKTLFYADFHFNWSILIGFLTNICNNELFLFGNSIVVSINHNVDIIAKSCHNSIVAFKLLFDPVELEIILNIFRK